jgi:acyl-CoA thioester hydrolase
MRIARTDWESDPLPTFSLRHRIRVRYAEIDGQSVVFNSRYLEYADVAITEYFRSLGISSVPEREKPEFHVVKATIEFKSPIRFDEEIDLCVGTLRVGRSSWTILIEIRGAQQDDLRATIEEVQVHVDLSSGRALPLPAWIRANIEKTEGPLGV